MGFATNMVIILQLTAQKQQFQSQIASLQNLDLQLMNQASQYSNMIAQAASGGMASPMGTPAGDMYSPTSLGSLGSSNVSSSSPAILEYEAKEQAANQMDTGIQERIKQLEAEVAAIDEELKAKESDQKEEVKTFSLVSSGNGG